MQNSFPPILTYTSKHLGQPGGSGFDEIKQMVEDSIGVVRNMALLWRPSMLDDIAKMPTSIHSPAGLKL
jgi:hypothetical protein